MWHRSKAALSLMKNRILIIDPDVAVREALKKVLQDAGSCVALAQDGQQGLCRLNDEAFDLLLMDLHLPEENGWDILEQVTNAFPLLPVVILTGLAHQGRAALAAGAGAFLEKPPEVPVLLNTIQHLLAEPLANRLRRFSSFLENTYWTPGISAGYLRRMPEPPLTPPGRLHPADSEPL